MIMEPEDEDIKLKKKKKKNNFKNRMQTTTEYCDEEDRKDTVGSETESVTNPGLTNIKTGH